jgi:hypothetical protein
MSLGDFRRHDPKDTALRARYADLMQDEATRTADHPDEDTWVRFACGELDGPARERVASHLVGCAECATIYRGVSELRREAQALDPPSRPVVSWPPVPGSRSSLVTYALAAAAVIVVLVGGALFVSSLRDAAPSRQAASPTSPAAPQAGAPRAWALDLKAPAVVLPAGLAIAMRGGEAGSRAFLQEFGAAVAPYRAGRYAEAAGLLRVVAGRYPHSREATFYLASALLLAGQPREAATLLAGGDWPEALREDARWLRAVALERMGEPRAADTELQGLCRAGGARQADACAALGVPGPAGR